MGISTFGSFTQARLGIYASQAGLSITGNNISNINTPGYTRQKLVQTSFYAGGSDRYYSSNELAIGHGTLCRENTQMRDPYLDIRFRRENSSVGAMDAKLSGLENVQRILDEVGDGNDGFGVLGAQLSDFFKQLENLNDQTGLAEYDIQVRSSAEALAKLFNSYSSQLKEVEQNAEKAFNEDIDAVNNILTSIRDLNRNIRKAELHGDGALELRDERNVLIDKLSGYMKIDVTYSMEDFGGIQLEKLTIKLGDANPDPAINTDQSVLVDGIYCTQIDVPDQIGGNDNASKIITLAELKDSKDRVLPGSIPVTLHDNDLYGSIQSQREFLTESGEFCSDADIAADPNAATKRGIPYYRKALDLLAKQFADTFNKANQGYVHNEHNQLVDIDGNVIQFNGNPILTSDLEQPSAELLAFLQNKANGAQFKGGPLFSNRGDNNLTNDINAGNISVSKDWSVGPMIVNSFTQHGNLPIASTDSSNIAHMLVLMNTKMDYTPKQGADPMFNGTFNEMWTNLGTILGNDMSSAGTMLKTYQTASVQLDTSRDSVSSVDLNDEAMNLMQYSKSYTAACRLMTTIDSVLDKLINGTGMTT